MLRARAPRRLPGALRRGLTFWRRSIQARVVASTVILTAVVIAAVGWLLLQQTRDGLLDQRVKAVTGEVADEVAGGRTAGSSQASGQDADPSVQRRDLTDLIIQRGTHPRVRRGGGRSRRRGRPDRRRRLPSRAATSRRPACRSRSRSTSTSPVPAAPGPTRRSRAPTTTTRWSAREPGIAVGAQVLLPADGSTYTVYFLFPLDEQQETMAARRPGPAHGGRAAARAGRGRQLAGHPAGGDPGADGPPGGRAARRRAAAGTAAGVRARTTWRGSRRRSTRWPPTCSARSASWRS